MIELRANILGTTAFVQDPVAEGLDLIRQAEIASIRRFVEEHDDLLQGSTLDFGGGKEGTCRKPQPYRELCGVEYACFDVGDEIPTGSFDAILCTQVAQYLPNILETFFLFHKWLWMREGYLVMTYGTAWPEVDAEDLTRYTKAGMERLLIAAGFEVVEHEPRAALVIGVNSFVLGYGVVARPLKNGVKA